MKAHYRSFTSQLLKKCTGHACPSEREGRSGFVSEGASVYLNFVDDYKSKLDWLGILLAKIGFGVILITSEGQIIYTNDVAKALLSSRRGLCHTQGRINAVDIAVNKKLQQIISAVNYPSRETSSGGSLLIRQQDGDESCVVDIVPIYNKTDNRIFSTDDDIIGLLVHYRDQEMVERVRLFAALFKLIPSEIRVFTELISGKGVACAAKQLNITELTARTHLKHIMEKTDTHRQAELVRLLFEMTIPSDKLRQPTVLRNGAARSETL
jgi:DNA-binding CsgD family transcriptional regulator